MTLFLIAYRPFSLLNPPRIHTDLLWDLGLLFGGITGLYFLLILMLRHRIAIRQGKVRIRKTELAPMITNFLFFSEDSSKADQQAYIRMKIEIRELLKTQINREVLSEVLLDLKKDLTGEARHRLLSLYQDLGLHQDAFRKLKSRRWELVSQGIQELTDMRVDQAYHIIKKRINDKKSVIRRQAQLATVNLREEGIRYVLDTARHRISEWQQLKLMELLKHKEEFVPPRFRDWLISENKDVVLFALRLIRHYRQNDAAKAIITLLQHRSTEIQAAALECIREFRFQQARASLKQHFDNATPEIKILVLDAFQEVALEEDLYWLQEWASKDPSFLVRSKAGTVINSLRPGTVLPTKDIQPFTEEGSPAWEEIPPPAYEASHDEADTLSQMSDEEITEELADRLLPRANFKDIQWHLSPDWDISAEALSINPALHAASLPSEDWSPEHEQIFVQCFMEELGNILSPVHPSVALSGLSLDFLPVVTEEPAKTDPMEPHQPIPEWLLKLDVRAEILSADTGYAKVLREILLEDLAETGQVFSTDFIPWVTEVREIDPDFGVIATDIQHIQVGPEMDVPPVETGEEASELEEDMNYFSIFREFFRSYDRESKLILMEEIPEIGTEKELYFLQELFEDTDAQVARKARQVYAQLAKRLGIAPDALKNKGSQALWTPSSAKGEKPSGSAPKNEAEPLESEFTEETEFDFIPHFISPAQKSQGPETETSQKVRKRKNHLFGFLKRNESRDDE